MAANRQPFADAAKGSSTLSRATSQEKLFADAAKGSSSSRPSVSPKKGRPSRKSGYVKVLSDKDRRQQVEELTQILEAQNLQIKKMRTDHAEQVQILRLRHEALCRCLEDVGLSGRAFNGGRPVDTPPGIRLLIESLEAAKLEEVTECLSGVSLEELEVMKTVVGANAPAVPSKSLRSAYRNSDRKYASLKSTGSRVTICTEDEVKTIESNRDTEPPPSIASGATVTAEEPPPSIPTVATSTAGWFFGGGTEEEPPQNAPAAAVEPTSGGWFSRGEVMEDKTADQTSERDPAADGDIIPEATASANKSQRDSLNLDDLPALDLDGDMPFL